MHRDFKEGRLDLTKVCWSKLNTDRAQVLVQVIDVRVPGIGTIHGFCASNQASEVWAGVACIMLSGAVDFPKQVLESGDAFKAKDQLASQLLNALVQLQEC